MAESLLAIVIMVKDEVSSIENTLAPYIKHNINDICVLDTGSTDNTVEVTKKFFKKHNANGFIKEEKFIDFAASRNMALQFAEEVFPATKFFLMIDADWQLENIPKLLEFCKEHISSNHSLFNIRVHCGNTDFVSSRLSRASDKIRYTGVVHETPTSAGTCSVPDDVFFIVSTHEQHRIKSALRYPRDVEMLLNDIKRFPLNSRNYFYLGQTYECMGDLHQAYKYYKKRLSLADICDPSETAVVYYRLGSIEMLLSRVDNEYTTEKSLNYFYHSLKLAPHRVEPYLAIAKHFIKEFPNISLLYLKKAYSLPYPHNDRFFVMKRDYEYTRYELLSNCAWSAKEYQLGHEATQLALKAEPQNSILQKRLTLYQNQLNS